MKKLLLIAFACWGMTAMAQLYCPTANSSGTTSYTNNSANDSIFYYCTGQTGQLIALPESGTPGWSFQWQQFDQPTNAWVNYFLENDVPSSTISNLAPGGYRVTITDGTNTIVGCYRAWIIEIIQGPTVDVQPIAPGCAGVNLIGSINYGQATAYFNPPSDPLIINSSTQITVCFWANHTYVSDLGFYLVGPVACGSPTVLLAPNPGTNCNSGNNINNLCFTNQPAPNFNVCGMTVPLTGTFDSYGAGQIPINWSPLYGCDATMPGWKVQIYDCVAIDVGALTQATITFTGTTICGNTATVIYDSGTINSIINDNSCTAATASSYTVPIQPAVAINPQPGYHWSADPPFTIPNFNSSLNISIPQGPAVNTNFTLQLDVNSNAPLCSGNTSDTELYVYVPPATPQIIPMPELCINDGAQGLVASIPGGTWSGPGIINANTGIFDPQAAGTGTHSITYTLNNECPTSASTFITVVSELLPLISPAGPFCIQTGNTGLTVNMAGGMWSGPGIVDSTSGTFSPQTAGAGIHLISYDIPGTCPAHAEILIEVVDMPVISIVNPGSFCANDPLTYLQASPAGGTWSGPGILNGTNGMFDPNLAGSGTHTITYSIVGLCPASNTVSIVIHPNPFVNAGADINICTGQSATLSASGAVSYTWSPATGLSNTSGSTTTASPAATTTYTVIGTDANGCSDDDQIQVIVNTAPVVNVSQNQTICAGSSTTLTASGLTSYTWTPQEGLSNPNAASTNAAPSNTTTYTVSGISTNGCPGSASVTVSVTQVSLAVTPTPSEGLAPLNVSFAVNSNGTSFNWDFGNGQTATTTGGSPNTNTTYETVGTYTVSVTATYLGCTLTSTFTVLAYNESFMIVPNVVTPNHDSRNEFFSIQSQFIKSFVIYIYNRWGQQVATFDRTDFKWDARDVNEGTYYYAIDAAGFDGKEYKLKGNVTVLR